MKPYIKKVFWLYSIIFLIVIAHLIKVSIWDSRQYASNPYNPRINQSQDNIKRGSILDIKENVIVESVKQEDDTYKRQYNYGSAFSHITGYSDRGKTGVESKYNYYMEKISNEFFQYLGNAFANKEIKGDDVVLTIDGDLQRYTAEQLGTSKGAVVALEPNSGKVLSMVSYPAFNPNTINQDWEYLHSDEANSPLLSRATQGLYPPGSIFKMVTATAALNTSSTYWDYEMYCQGEKDFGSHTMHCFNSTAHRQETMLKAFAQSCNTYFATIGMEVGAKKLIDTSNDFLFNQELDFDLEYSTPLFQLSEDATTSEIIETSIGQGKTMVSPLFMAMITSAIANNGMMMKPYIFDHSINNWGLSVNKTIPEKLSQVISPEIATQLTQLMKEVVNSGTATQAQFYTTGLKDMVTSDSVISDNSIVSGGNAYESTFVQVAGKTGTAENNGGADHAWFVAFAPADNPKIAVAVVLENAGKGSKAVPIARNVMKYYMDNCIN